MASAYRALGALLLLSLAAGSCLHETEPSVTLTVVSDAGEVLPPPGDHAYRAGDTVVVTCGDHPWTDPDDPSVHRYVCRSCRLEGAAVSEREDRSFSFVIEQDTVLTWQWVRQRRLTAVPSPTAAGNVTADPPSADGFYDEASRVTLTAEPCAGYLFHGFSGNVFGSEPVLELVLTISLTEVARFGKWRPLPNLSSFDRTGHVAAWTGDRILFWGGRSQCGIRADGVIFDPRAGTLRCLAAAPLLPSWGAAGAWTGTRFLVWGGFSNGGSLADGAAYDPDQDAWTSLAYAPLRPRHGHGWAWTGQALAVWGGWDSDGQTLADGALLDPETGAWTLFAPGPLEARGGHSLLWAGDCLAVFAGEGDSGYLDAGLYRP